MARHLKMAEISAIRTLHEQGHSNREIARLVGVNRETVGKYVSQLDSKPAKPDHRVRSGPTNACEPFRELILIKLEQGLSGQRIFQDLCQDHQFRASYSSVRRFLQSLHKASALPVRRLETTAGDEAQIDFGTAAPVIAADGKRRHPWLFRVVLSHSRKGYCEVVWRQTTDNFIAAMENAFQYFGGVPKRLVIDNLKAAVKRADWYDPEIHPKLQSFAAHYATTIMPTKPYRPDHKGKVESGVKYAKNNALKGRTFNSLAEQNEFLLKWEESVADTRIHGTTKQQVGRVFRDVEQPVLLALPAERFPSFHEARRHVHRDGYVEVNRAYYSVPPEYLGRQLWVRWDTRLVRIFDCHWRSLATHATAEPGRFRTHSSHIPREKISSVERGADELLRHASMLGQQTGRWAAAMAQARGVEGIRVLVGLKALAAKHSVDALERACKTALAHGAYRLKTIRHLLKHHDATQQHQFDFIEEHPVIRPLSDYSLDSLHDFRKERNHEPYTS